MVGPNIKKENKQVLTKKSSLVRCTLKKDIEPFSVKAGGVMYNFGKNASFEIPELVFNRYSNRLEIIKPKTDKEVKNA